MQATARLLALGVSTAALTMALLAGRASAHHSSVAYDMTQAVAFEGVVTAVRWANPHVYITVLQTTDAGATIEWEVETVGPSALVRIGWSRDSLSVGDQVSLQGSPARSGDHSLILRSLELEGETFNVMMDLIRAFTGPGEAPGAGASSLDGRWATRPNFALLGPFLPRGPKPALTEAGAAAAAGFDEKSMLPAAQCVQLSAPASMFTPDVKQITIGDDAITIVGDYEGAERTIHMKVADHEGAEPSAQGHSIGRWEGDTLVIDTTAFAPLAMAHAYGVPSGAQKHLVERLTLNEDGTRIAYLFEVSDPEFLAAPIAGEVEWAYRPDLELAVEPCDPEAARRFARE
jgi:hypothetical protein